MLWILVFVLGSFVGEQDKDVTVLAKVPDGYTVVDGTLRFALNGSKVAYAVKKGDKSRPVVDSTLGDECDVVMRPLIQPNGEHVAFRVVTYERSRGARWTLLYDGKAIASDDWISQVALSPNDGTPAFWVSHGRINNADGSLSHGPMALQFGKVKGKKWQATEELMAPCFASNGKFVVAIGRRDDDLNVIVLDAKGKESKAVLGLSYQAIVSPDGKELVCTVGEPYYGPWRPDRLREFHMWRTTLESAQDPKAARRVSGETRSSAAPVFSADGRHLAFRIEEGSKFGVVLDDARDAKCTDDFVDDICIAPETAQVAYSAGKGCKLSDEHGWEVLAGTTATGGKWSVVQGTERSAAYDHVRDLCWSPDGQHLAYAACKDGKWRVYVGANSSEDCDDVACITWASDGKSLNFGGRIGAELSWRKFAIE